MGRLRAAGLALALVFSPSLATAEVFRGQLDIYTMEPPSGWGYRKDSNSDMNFDAPGGNTNGGMFVGLKDATLPIDTEIDEFIGYDTVLERRTVYIDGHSCRVARTQKTTSLTIVNTMLLCHIVVPFSEGDVNLSFFYGMVSRAGDSGWHADLFWKAANTIRWGGAFAAAP